MEQIYLSKCLNRTGKDNRFFLFRRYRRSGSNVFNVDIIQYADRDNFVCRRLCFREGIWDDLA
jgi:hypothetical protein